MNFTQSKKEAFMRTAIDEAVLAGNKNEIPVGAVVVYGGEIIARGHNEKEERKTSIAHAEILAIERACTALNSWRLDECALFVTMEPCAMCAGAMINSRLGRLYYGTPDIRFGACGSVYDLPKDKKLNHTFSVESGILKEDCLELLQSFFKRLRNRT